MTTFLDEATSKTFRDSVLIPSQNSFDDCLQSPAATQKENFKNETL